MSLAAPVSPERASKSRWIHGPADLGLWHLGALAAVGVIFDAAIARGPATLASAVCVAAMAGLLLASGRIVTPSARALALLAPPFGCFLAWRASPWVVIVDLVIAWGLLGAAVAFANRGRVWDAPFTAWAGTARRALCDAFDGVPLVVRSLARHRGLARSEEGRALLLGVALAVPLVGALGSLLVWADAVFASVLPVVDAAGSARHAASTMAGAGAAAMLLRIAAGAGPDPSPRARVLRPRTTDVVLAALVALYGFYTATVVIAGLIGAGAFVDDPQEVADWARTGFFQLLAVAGITLIVLVALRAATTLSGAGEVLRFRLFTSVAVLLTLAIVASAVARIAAYSEAYGLTMLRLYSGLFACWLGLAFALFLVAAWRREGRGEWWPFASAVAGLVIVIALNIANPEAQVVRYNIAGLATVERFDPSYLAGLSDDAIPALVSRLDSLSPSERAAVLGDLCLADDPKRGLAWNYAGSAAAKATESLCTGR